MANRDKVKVWCRRCFEQRIQEEQLLDIQRGGVVRETKDIEVACECSTHYRHIILIYIEQYGLYPRTLLVHLDGLPGQARQ